MLTVHIDGRCIQNLSLNDSRLGSLFRCAGALCSKLAKWGTEPHDWNCVVYKLLNTNGISQVRRLVG